MVFIRIKENSWQLPPTGFMYDSGMGSLRAWLSESANKLLNCEAKNLGTDILSISLGSL